MNFELFYNEKGYNSWVVKKVTGKRSRGSAIILILFILLLSGCTVSQDSEEEEKDDEIDPMEKWRDLFNTPSWNTTYLLENVLDQFTVGLKFPDKPIFNTTSDQSNPQRPVVYWRLSSLESYEYTDKPPYTTDWNPAEPTYNRVISPTASDIYSQQIPSKLNPTQFAIRIPMDHSTPLADVTIHPYFTNYIPTTWNGLYGSYVDSNSFTLYDSNSIQLTASTVEARELFSYATTNDLLGINANVQVNKTSEEKGFLEYTLDYMSPNIQQAAAFSMTRDENNYLKCLDSNTWANIKNLYLQLPNTPADMPPFVYVSGTGMIANPQNYSDWAPTVVNSASDWNQPEQTVFGQAYYNMHQFENFTFDQEQWLAAETGIPADHPAEYEDYNEWFMRRQKGISLHFASTLAAIMRLQGIPSRVVIGFLAGNDSAQYYPWRVVTGRFLHAWVEVLVPIDTFLDQHVEWVSFDPLLSYLTAEYDMNLPTGIVPAFLNENQTTFIRPDYDLETNGLAAAFFEHLDAQSLDEEILERCIVNNSAFAQGGVNETSQLVHGEDINISTRLIRAPSLGFWLPYQGANVSFYVGSTHENTTGGFIEENGIYIGSAITDSQGMVTIDVTIDTTKFGLRVVNFYAVWKPEKGVVRKGAISLQYNLVLP